MTAPVYYCNITQHNMEEYYESIRLSKTVDPYVSLALLARVPDNSDSDAATDSMDVYDDVTSIGKRDALAAFPVVEEDGGDLHWTDRMNEMVQFTNRQKSLNDDMDVDMENVATTVIRQRAIELVEQGAQLLYQLLASTVQEHDSYLSNTLIFDSASVVCDLEKSLLDKQKNLFAAADPLVRESFRSGQTFEAFLSVYQQHVLCLIQVMTTNSTSGKSGWETKAMQEMTKSILTKANLDHPKKLPINWEQYTQLYKPLVLALSNAIQIKKPGNSAAESAAHQTARLAQTKYHQQYTEFKKGLDEFKTYIRKFMQQNNWPLEPAQRDAFVATVSSTLNHLRYLRTELTTQEIQLRNMSRYINWDSVQVIVDDCIREDVWLQEKHTEEFVLVQLSPEFEYWISNAIKLFEIYSSVSQNPSELLRECDESLLEANMANVYEQVTAISLTALIDQIRSVVCEVSSETGDWAIKNELLEIPSPTSVVQQIGQFPLRIQGPPPYVESWKRVAEILVRWPDIVNGCRLVPFYCRSLSKFRTELRDQFPPNKAVQKKKPMHFMVKTIEEMQNSLIENNVPKLGAALVKSIQETFDAIDARKEGVSDKNLVASYKAAKESFLLIS
jgi:hypothetical protein